MSDARRVLPAFTPLHWVSAGATGLAALFLLTFPVTISPRFVHMFRDFSTAIPGFTQLVVGGGFPSLLGAVCGGFVGLALVLRQNGNGTAARMLVLGGVLFGVVAVSFCVGALYLPLFQVTNAVAPQ